MRLDASGVTGKRFGLGTPVAPVGQSNDGSKGAAGAVGQHSQVEELRIRLRGVMTALITPFAADLSLDLGALRQHVEYQVAAGVQTIVVGGTIGESQSLSHGERQEASRVAVETAAGRAVVLVGVASERLPVIEALAQHARECGADGLLVTLPAYFKLTEAEQLDFFSWIDTVARLPWILYGASGVASGPPSNEVLRQVTDMDWFSAYKEPRPDLARMHQLMQHFGPELPVIAASEIAIPQMLLAGAVGVMTASSCFAPSLVNRLVQGLANRRLDAAWDAFESILRFRALLQTDMAKGFPSYVPYTKAACEAVGLSSGPPRPPLRGLTPDQSEQVETVVRAISAAEAQQEPAP